jgi:hypothetical protein
MGESRLQKRRSNPDGNGASGRQRGHFVYIWTMSISRKRLTPNRAGLKRQKSLSAKLPPLYKTKIGPERPKLPRHSASQLGAMARTAILRLREILSRLNSWICSIFSLDAGRMLEVLSRVGMASGRLAPMK